MKKTAQQIEHRVLQMNLDVEAMEIVCQWKNIVMVLSIAPTEVTKICADSKQIQVQFQTMTAKINQVYFHVTTLASRS
jgi:hypothetical protein